MSDDFEFMNNDNDPAADFLARESEELGELGELIARDIRDRVLVGGRRHAIGRAYTERVGGVLGRSAWTKCLRHAQLRAGTRGRSR